MKTTTFLVTVMLCVSVAGYAQSGANFGLRAGVNFQNLNGEDPNGTKLDNKLKPGFHAGVNAEIPVAPEFYIQPGLLYSLKGAKSDDGDVKINLSYVELPINFLYKPVLGSGKLLLGFGPYAAFGIGGNVNVNGTKHDIQWENKITTSQDLTGIYFKRFDAGANLLFGYEMSSKISAQLNAQLGLLNISPEITNMNARSTVKNTGFGISIGYRL